MRTATYTVLELFKEANTFYSTEFSDEYYYSADIFDHLQDFQDKLIGNVVLKQKEGNSFFIVDGLQRLLTISLLLYALCECYKKTTNKNEEARTKIQSRYLLRNGVPKIQLRGKDQIIYNKIILSERLTDDEKETPLFKVLHGFWSKIKSEEISATFLFKQIARLKAFVTSTDDENTTLRDLYALFNKDKAEPLSLIKSFIKEKSIGAKNTFKECFALFEEYGYEDIFVFFLKDFVSINLDQEVQVTSIYESFKQYYRKVNKFNTPEEIAANIKMYAIHFLKIMQADFQDEQIKTLIEQIKENDGQDTFSYLMEVLDDFEHGHITQDMFIDILKMVNSFVEQRTDGTEINFATLSNELNKMLVSKI